jgi:hypothetical protein
LDEPMLHGHMTPAASAMMDSVVGRSYPASCSVGA